tara:strand:- start:519 stop:1391 length:873 start_codon:yes stop_codon:yes gene_type:complete
MNIVIAGLAKNCEDNFKKNIEYLIDFKEFYKETIEISILILENDSKDNTKEIIKKSSNKEYITDYCLDGLDTKLTNRIERITYCRNFLLEKLTSFQSQEAECLYISIDFDLDLFSKTPKEKFFQILNKLRNQKDLTAVFPNNVPYYYDVHALRKDKWNSIDSWKKYNQISKYIPVGKFFLKYFLIYKKQIKINTNREFINVDSAFGGIGIYKMTKSEFSNIKYESDKLFEKCEHINFNSYFNCAIYTSWKVESPKEHLEYKNLNSLNKLRYILSSFIGDVKNIFLYLKKN